MSPPEPERLDPSPDETSAEPAVTGPWGSPAEESAPAVPDAGERSDFALFVDRNARAYLEIFDSIAARRQKGLLFWPGIFIPQAWLLYRKMYGWAALACVMPVLILSFHLGGEIGRALGFAPSLIGLFGQRLYVHAARRTIASIRATAASGDEARDLIRRAGGVSRAGATAGGLIVAVQLGIGVMIGLQAHHLAGLHAHH